MAGVLAVHPMFQVRDVIPYSRNFCRRKFPNFVLKQAFQGINFAIHVHVDILCLCFDIFACKDFKNKLSQIGSNHENVKCSPGKISPLYSILEC